MTRRGPCVVTFGHLHSSGKCKTNDDAGKPVMCASVDGQRTPCIPESPSHKPLSDSLTTGIKRCWCRLKINSSQLQTKRASSSWS